MASYETISFTYSKFQGFMNQFPESPTTVIVKGECFGQDCETTVHSFARMTRLPGSLLNETIVSVSSILVLLSFSLRHYLPLPMAQSDEALSESGIVWKE